MPGMDANEVEVKLANGILTTGEKKEAKEEREKDRFLPERRYGTFQRSFRLPPRVDADNIDATFANGVLTVRLPKTDEASRWLGLTAGPDQQRLVSSVSIFAADNVRALSASARPALHAPGR
ncbi:Hsp20/alpha crystallin family protein [Sinorhizobium meliloti]|uniref:Hsp20/alpha crystallin family protein n=1 Tax=Rhizobium meliloti TaxID=382 RepID=UPI002D7A28E2|nr:Hsp20/alpha crystallin family protein [Sinorhizobium meliloti]